MTQNFQIPAGSRIRVGAPAQPLPEKVLQQLTKQLRSVPDIVEAHLPLVHLLDTMPGPAQILIVVFDRKSDLKSALPSIAEIARETIPMDSHLDIWPLCSGDPLVGAIRKANCMLFGPTKPRPWWKF